MPPKRGLKRLLSSSEDDAGHAAAVASSLPSSSSRAGPRGGIRARLGEPDFDDGGGASRPEAAAPKSGRAVFASHSWGDAGSNEPRRGGLRSRLAEEIEEGTGGSAALPFNANMKRDWGSGKLSSVKVVEYASGSSMQGATGVGKMGSGTPKNAQRTLMNYFGVPAFAPPTTWAQIPMINGATMHPFYMPHHWFASLKEANRAVWGNSVRGPEGAAPAFWESMRDTPFIARHPKLR